ncbi:DUF6928 family protein, partial [Streptomyces sp. NPDC020845]|uniref:DUF6928 family protein n=1 Tax=Streptomyces sp. NPDC020845 TaxID=3365096 RepID=UPI00379838BB
MGAKTGLLVFADGDVPNLLRQVGAADLRRTSAMMRRLYPGWTIEESAGSNLCEGVYPPDGTAYAASWPGVEIVCDRHVMIDFCRRRLNRDPFWTVEFGPFRVVGGLVQSLSVAV